MCLINHVYVLNEEISTKAFSLSEQRASEGHFEAEWLATLISQVP